MNPIKLAEIARIADMLAPYCEEDEQLFADMIEAETDVHYFIGKLHAQIASDTELLTGIAARQEMLAERKARLTARTAASKAAIGQLLRAAMLTKIELPEASYSVRDGKPSLQIIDPAAVPAEYQRVKTEPDKSAINEAFGDAQELPNWLCRETARDVVTARVR